MTLVRFDKRRAGSGTGPPGPPRQARIIPFPGRDWRSLRRYWLVVAGMLGVLAATFALISALGVPLLSDPWTAIVRYPGLSAALVFGLLTADVVLPVPASLVMIASGAVFGPVAGAALSLAGGVAGSAVAFAAGRRGSPLLVKLVGSSERAVADGMLERHGALAILVTRPVPLLAETTAVLAGASPLPWSRALVAAAVGTLPAAAVYAVAGWLTIGFPQTAMVLGGVLLLGVGFRLAERTCLRERLR